MDGFLGNMEEEEASYPMTLSAERDLYVIDPINEMEEGE